MIDTYHHGDLRRAVLDRAVQVIARDGAEALSLRGLAADLGVSHTAPRHHFASRQGLLTAVAVEGFRELHDRLRQAGQTGSFLDVGVEYVAFALDRPAHFSVMFTPYLLDLNNPELIEAMDATFAVLREGTATLSDPAARQDAAAAAIAAWSLVHGLATLVLTGNLDRAGVRALLPANDILGLARRTAGMLFGPSLPEPR